MNWNDCKDVARGGNLQNIHLHGIYNDQSQLLHGSEEYKRYFDEECGKIGHIYLDETPKMAIGLSFSATDPRLIGIKTIHSESKRYASGLDEEVMHSRSSGNKSDKFTSGYNSTNTSASSIEEPDGANYLQHTFSVGTLVDKTSHKIASRCYYPDQIESCSFDTASFDRQDFCGQVLLKSKNSPRQLTGVPLNVTFVESRKQINNVNVPCNTGHNNEITKLSTAISSETNQRFTEENVNFLSSGKDTTKNRSDVKMKNKTNNRKNCTKALTSKTFSPYAESTSSKLFVGEHGYKGIKRKHDAIRADEEGMFAKECVFSQPAAKANKYIQVVCDSNEDLKQCTRDCATMARFVNVRQTEVISINEDSDNKECAFPQCYYSDAFNGQHDTVTCHQRIYHPVLHPNFPDETKHTTKNTTCTDGMEGELKVFPTCMQASVQAKEEINEFERQYFDTLSSEVNYYATNKTPNINRSQMKNGLNNRDEKIQNLKELLAQQEKTLEKLRESRLLAKKTMDKNATFSWLKNKETDGYHGSSDLESLPKNSAKNVLGVKKSWLKAWNEENNIVTTDEDKSRQQGVY